MVRLRRTRDGREESIEHAKLVRDGRLDRQLLGRVHVDRRAFFSAVGIRVCDALLVIGEFVRIGAFCPEQSVQRVSRPALADVVRVPARHSRVSLGRIFGILARVCVITIKNLQVRDGADPLVQYHTQKHNIRPTSCKMNKHAHAIL